MGLPVTVGGKVTAADINDISGLPVANFAALPASGNWLGRRISTSDTGRAYRWSGSAWVGADGAFLTATFSAVSTVTIDGLTGFDEYEIAMDMPTASTANALTAQLRVAAVAAVTNYDRQIIVGSGASAAAAELLAQTSWDGFTSAGARADKHVKVTLYGLNVAARTVGRSEFFAADASSQMLAGATSLRHRTATAYDGIRFTTTTGTITGSYVVKGIRY